MQQEAIVVKSSVNQLQQHAPPVIFFWQIEVKGDQEISQTILPTIYHDLIFPLHGGVKVEGYPQMVSTPFAGPLLKKSLKITFSPNSHIFGIRLNPLYVNHIFRISTARLIQGPNMLQAVLKSKIYHEVTRIISQAPFHELMKSLNDYFNAQTFTFSYGSLINQSLEQIRQNPEVSLALLSDQNQCSKKWLQVQFQKYLGARPYEFIKLSRFNRFLSLLNTNAGNSLTTLALEAGYYDQSHLIREFRNYNANTPRILKQNLNDFYRIMNHT